MSRNQHCSPTKSTPWLVVFATWGLFLLVPARRLAIAQQALSADDAIAALAVHAFEIGVRWPDSVRRRVARDPHALGVFADLLEGRRVAQVAWDTGGALWWLAESGDSRFLPLFLRFSSGKRGHGVLSYAIYGLARQAHTSTVARQRLRELAASSPLIERANVAIALIYVNDDSARAIARDLPASALPGEVRALLRQVLNGRPLQAGTGKLPCDEQSKLALDTSGSYACVRRP